MVTVPFHFNMELFKLLQADFGGEVLTQRTFYNEYKIMFTVKRLPATETGSVEVRYPCMLLATSA